MKSEQYSAIDKSKRLSILIAEQIPEIAEDYRNGLSLFEIIDKYSLMERYNLIGKITTKSSVSYALKHLIPSEELRKLRLIHNKEKSVKGLFVRGCTFWNDDEKSLLCKLIEENKSRDLIAKLINNLLHDGNVVRTRKSINSMVYRLKKEY